jgi:hypothetical protein
VDHGRQFAKMGFAGSCNLEHEVKDDDHLTAMQRSFACFRGVLAGLG